MACLPGGYGRGGRLSLLPEIRRHEDEVEMDLLLLGIDYRDFYKPHGGPSQLTLRRLLLIVDSLDKASSHFWCAVADVDRLSSETIVLAHIYQAVTGEPHRMLTRREDERKRRAFEAKKARIRAAERRRRRLMRSL